MTTYDWLWLAFFLAATVSLSALAFLVFPIPGEPRFPEVVTPRDDEEGVCRYCRGIHLDEASVAFMCAYCGAHNPVGGGKK